MVYVGRVEVNTTRSGTSLAINDGHGHRAWTPSDIEVTYHHIRSTLIGCSILVIIPLVSWQQDDELSRSTSQRALWQLNSFKWIV